MERTYLDIDGKGVLSKNGYAGWRSKFDDRGNEIEKSYLNEEGQVSDLAVEGIAIVRYKYDALGRQIERVLFDKNMNAVNAKNSGRGIVRTRYAVGSLLLSESSFDKNGQPVDRLDEHWSTKEWEYDQKRNVKKITLIDKYGKVLH